MAGEGQYQKQGRVSRTPGWGNIGRSHWGNGFCPLENWFLDGAAST
jgi:hypothetical protein